jgi:hypothetical protein
MIDRSAVSRIWSGYSLTKPGFQEWRQRHQRAQGRHRGQKRSDGNGSIWLNYSPTDTGDAAADEAFNNAALDEEPWHPLGLLMLRAE